MGMASGASSAARVPARGPHFVLGKGQSAPGWLKGLLIGRNGDNLKFIQNECHVRVSLEDEEEGLCFRLREDFRLGGADMQKAAKQVKDLIEYAREKYSREKCSSSHRGTTAGTARQHANAWHKPSGPHMVQLSGAKAKPAMHMAPAASKAAWGGMGLQRNVMMAAPVKFEIAEDLQSEVCASTTLDMDEGRDDAMSEQTADDDAPSELAKDETDDTLATASNMASAALPLREDDAIANDPSTLHEEGQEEEEEKPEQEPQEEAPQDAWVHDEPAAEASDLEEWEMWQEDTNKNKSEETSPTPQRQDSAKPSALWKPGPACECPCSRMTFSRFLQTGLAYRLNKQAAEHWTKKSAA